MDPMIEWITRMLTTAQNQPGIISEVNQGPGTSPQMAQALQGLNPEAPLTMNIDPAFAKTVKQVGATTEPGIKGTASQLETMPPARIKESRNPEADSNFMNEAHPGSGPTTFQPRSQNTIGDEKSKKKDLSALLPLLKMALGGGGNQAKDSRFSPGGVSPGRGGAIAPSLPALASLPLPGVNLRERLSGRTRT